MQQRLKALLDLQGILQRQELTQDQLKLVRDQVSALGPISKPPPVPSNIPATSTPPVVAPPLQTVPQPLQQLLNPGTLAGLIKATATRQQPTPPPQTTNVVPQVPANTSTPQPIAGSGPENPLIAALRARGILPSVAPVGPSSVPPAPSLAPSLPLIIPGQAQYAAPAATPQVPHTSDTTVNVQMTTASIKM